MNEHEAERIAGALNLMRPDWPKAQLRTLIREKLADRPRRDVAVALAWVACESGSANPYRVLETGPWWRAAGVEGTTQPRHPYDKGGCCSTCSLPHERCRQVWADNHPYISAAEYAKTVNHDPERIARIVEACKAEAAASMRAPAKPRESETPELDHEDCDEEIAAALAKGDDGRAEYLAARCDLSHQNAAAVVRAEQPGRVEVCRVRVPDSVRGEA